MSEQIVSDRDTAGLLGRVGLDICAIDCRFAKLLLFLECAEGLVVDDSVTAYAVAAKNAGLPIPACKASTGFFNDRLHGG